MNNSFMIKEDFKKKVIQCFKMYSVIESMKQEVNNHKNKYDSIVYKIERLNAEKSKLNEADTNYLDKINHDIDKYNKIKEKIEEEINEMNARIDLYKEKYTSDKIFANIFDAFNKNTNYQYLCDLIENKYNKKLKYYPFLIIKCEKVTDAPETKFKEVLAYKKLLVSDNVYQILKDKEGKLTENQLYSVICVYDVGSVFDRECIDLECINDVTSLDNNLFQYDIIINNTKRIENTCEVLFEYAKELNDINKNIGKQILTEIIDILSDKVNNDKDFSVKEIEYLLSKYELFNKENNVHNENYVPKDEMNQ